MRYAFAVDDFDSAVTICLQVQQEQNDPEKLGALLVDCVIRRGNANRCQKAFPESIKDYDEAIQRWTRFPRLNPKKSGSFCSEEHV